MKSKEQLIREVAKPFPGAHGRTCCISKKTLLALRKLTKDEIVALNKDLDRLYDFTIKTTIAITS